MATVKKTTSKKTSTRRVVTRKVAPAKKVVVTVEPQKNRMIGFFESIRNLFLGYFNFLGRSTRSEFWFGALFVFGINFLVFFIFHGGLIFSLINLLLFIPFVALSARRFQDVGLSVWWYMIPCLLFYLIPVFRSAAWARFLALNMLSLDMVLYSFFAIAFLVFCLVVACLPTKK